MFEHWGTTQGERAAHYPCQDLVPGGVLLTRGVDTTAPADVVWRWVCQVQVAPYSYDLVDNLGRRSPRTLTPGLEDVQVGARVYPSFTVRHVDPGRSLTFTGMGVAISYVVSPGRLVGALAMRHAPVLSTLLAGGDLVMMRKQLRTLAALSART